MSTETPAPRRRYEKRARATQEQETRLRILEAALGLHGSLGPSRTTISAIADRAGVRRATVYRHFPDERALFLGCSGLASERNPPPDPALWSTIADPAERLEAALDEIYRWYEQTEPLLTAVLRDVDTMPIIAELQAGRLAYLAAVEDSLVAGWGLRGTAARRLRATIGLALDFLSWRTLHLRGLSQADAIAVMSSAVRAAAAGG
jgi:AcrR family transcriptional regulator